MTKFVITKIIITKFVITKFVLTEFDCIYFQSESRETLQEVKRKDLTDIIMYSMSSDELPEFFQVSFL